MRAKSSKRRCPALCLFEPLVTQCKVSLVKANKMKGILIQALH